MLPCRISFRPRRGVAVRRMFLISCLGLIGTIPVAEATSVKPAGPLYREKPIRIIDIHLHPGLYEDMGPTGKAFLRRTLPSFVPDALKDLSLSLAAKLTLQPYSIVGGIKSECESAQVEMCGLFAVYAPETWGVTSNDRIIGWLDDPRNRSHQGRPYFFGLASVSMADWPQKEEAALGDLRRALKHPLMRGIKLAFIHNDIPLDDPTYDSVYQVAEEFEVPVYHHVGSSPLRKLVDFGDEGKKRRYMASYDPSHIERTIAAHPKIPFILGHVGFDFNKEGFDFTDDVYALAEKYPNVYLEISGFGTPFHDPDGKIMVQVLKSIKERGLVDRTIFGSDGPTVPGGSKTYIKSTLKALDQVGYSHEEAEKILSETTRRLFKLDM